MQAAGSRQQRTDLPFAALPADGDVLDLYEVTTVSTDVCQEHTLRQTLIEEPENHAHSVLVTKASSRRLHNILIALQAVICRASRSRMACCKQQ